MGINIDFDSTLLPVHNGVGHDPKHGHWGVIRLTVITMCSSHDFGTGSKITCDYSTIIVA